MNQILSIIFISLVVLGICLSVIKFLINLYLEHKDILEPKKAVSKFPINLSVHIPTRAEPFEVVKACIDSIYEQLNETDEIIVIDNNHTCQSDYLPLKEYCEKLNIHFEHQDFVEGFKAGAMNIALKATSPQATNILVVDCDYILERNAINEIKDLARQHVDFAFLQFPQAYIVKHKYDVNNELTKYFSYNLLFNRNHSLGTGTLCCIKKSTLQAIDGWPTDSITEDALFGLRVQDNGETGLYIPKMVGRGYLPTTIKDFYNQRKRWIYGNAEVLFHMFKTRNYGSTKLRNIAQLATWLNFAALTLLVHVVSILLTLFDFSTEVILWFVYLHYLIIFFIKLYEFSQIPISSKAIIKAFLIQWQFLVVASLHWLPVLFNKSKEFVRTPKIVGFENSNLDIPIAFLILNILTLFLCFNYLPIAIASSFFIIVEVLSIKVLTTNFKT